MEQENEEIAHIKKIRGELLVRTRQKKLFLIVMEDGKQYKIISADLNLMWEKGQSVVNFDRFLTTKGKRFCLKDIKCTKDAKTRHRRRTP
ncbi:MAG: hypothetical protein Q8O88_02940 [bacterium]|nr:hypothetical protein [bacterium]